MTITLKDPGRFAVTHDGNYHDKDDIGALAMVEALVWRVGVLGAGRSGDLVHLSHSNHIGANDADQRKAMKKSAKGFHEAYGIPANRILDANRDRRRAISHLARQIEASTASDPLTIVQAGPWEFMARAFDLAPTSSHKHVTILSHSDWNDNHKHDPWHRDRDTFFQQHGSPNYKRIPDQNGYAFKAPMSQWEWLLEDRMTAFVYRRTDSAGYAAGDMSDAGMVLYLLTGIDEPTILEVREFFGV